MFYYAVSEFIIEVYKLILKHVLGQNNNSTIRAVVALHNIEILGNGGIAQTTMEKAVQKLCKQNLYLLTTDYRVSVQWNIQNF